MLCRLLKNVYFCTDFRKLHFFCVMNISYKWLKEYVDFDLTPQQVCDALTSTGLEVDALEEVQSIKGGLKGLYVGKVLTCEMHPDSDHLHVTTVDLGKGEPQQIVCGAPNVAAGLLLSHASGLSRDASHK